MSRRIQRCAGLTAVPTDCRSPPRRRSPLRPRRRSGSQQSRSCDRPAAKLTGHSSSRACRGRRRSRRGQYPRSAAWERAAECLRTVPILLRFAQCPRSGRLVRPMHQMCVYCRCREPACVPHAGSVLWRVRQFAERSAATRPYMRPVRGAQSPSELHAAFVTSEFSLHPRWTPKSGHQWTPEIRPPRLAR